MGPLFLNLLDIKTLSIMDSLACHNTFATVLSNIQAKSSCTPLVHHLCGYLHSEERDISVEETHIISVMQFSDQRTFRREIHCFSDSFKSLWHTTVVSLYCSVTIRNARLLKPSPRATSLHSIVTFLYC